MELWLFQSINTAAQVVRGLRRSCWEFLMEMCSSCHTRTTTNTGTQEGSKKFPAALGQHSAVDESVLQLLEWCLEMNTYTTHTLSNAQLCFGQLSHNHKALKHLETIRIKYKSAFQEWNRRKVHHVLA